MKTIGKFMALLLTLVMAFSVLSACGTNPAPTPSETKGEQAQTNDAEKTQESQSAEAVETQPAPEAPQECAAEGEYLLDGAPLGMPMQWYLKITKEGTFQISTGRDYAADKGNGQVAENNGTFVLVYSDSTNEAPKNATFFMKDGNVCFTTPLPIGSASMPGSEESPFVGYCYANEDLLGEYVSEYVSVGGMGTVVYDLAIELMTGRRFRYTSVFTMMGAEYTYAEEGSFEITGKEISLTPYKKVTIATIEDGSLADIEAPEAVKGTMEDGVITIAMLTSPMKADRVECVFTAATTSEVAGSYVGYKATERFQVDSLLKLGKDGRYSYTSDFQSGAMGGVQYYEEGNFAIGEGTVILTPVKTRMDDEELAEVKEPAANELAVNGLILSGKMPTGGMPTSLTLVRNNIVGTFTAGNAEEAAEGEKAYTPVLTMRGDQSFTLTVKSGSDEAYLVEGSFEATASRITFTYEEGASKFIAMLSGNSFNAKDIPLNAEGDEASFEFHKAPAEEVVE